MAQTEQAREQLQAEAKALESVEYLVATNEGTYGATEACRKCGTGDPAFANRHEYETVGGQKRVTGPDLEDMPGRLRSINRDELSNARKRLAEIRKLLAKG